MARRRQPQTLVEGTVTALRRSASRPDRVAVYLDSHYAFELEARVVDEAGLMTGSFLPVGDQLVLLGQDAPHLARERALRLLSVRDRSTAEIEVRLRSLGLAPDVVSDTVIWLTDLGYLDDRRFACRFLHEKAQGGWGTARIRLELLRKGVDRSLVEEVLAEAEMDPDERSERERALAEELRRRFKGALAADPTGTERRVTGYLQRRGYEWETIGRMLKSLRDG